MNRNIPAFTAVMLVVALILAAFGGVVHGGGGAMAESQSRNIYLTFDDGPSQNITPDILDVLKEENVKATFFIVGKNARKHPEILKRTVAEGHAVGVHSYSHDYKKIYASAEALKEDVLKCSDIIEKTVNIKPILYRFPGGSFNISEEFKNCVREMGYKAVDWNASFRDSELKSASADELFDAAVTTAANHENIIILAHDSATKRQTVNALKQVISHYKNLNYKFKTL